MHSLRNITRLIRGYPLDDEYVDWEDFDSEFESEDDSRLPALACLGVACIQLSNGLQAHHEACVCRWKSVYLRSVYLIPSFCYAL